MSVLNDKQYKAIQNFCDRGYRPELSAHPIYRFTNKKTQEIESHNIMDLVDWHRSDKIRASKERARLKKLEKKPRA